MKSNKIKINNQVLETKFDQAALYRYSNVGGSLDYLEGKAVSKDEAFACSVKLVWCMLKGKSAKKYPTCEDLSYLLYPQLKNDEIVKILELAILDAKEMEQG